MNGIRQAAKRISVYSNTCRRVNALPCVTGSIGRPDWRDSSPRDRASAQKCGGVHKKVIRNRISRSGATGVVIAAQPSAGGMAPEAPPITMFCGVRGLRISGEKNPQTHKRGKERKKEQGEE